MDGGSLRQVAPAARGEVPHSVPRVCGLHPVLPLQGVPDGPTLALEALRRVGNARYARRAPRHGRNGIGNCTRQRRKLPFPHAGTVDRCGRLGDGAGADRPFGGEEPNFRARHDRIGPVAGVAEEAEGAAVIVHRDVQRVAGLVLPGRAVAEIAGRSKGRGLIVGLLEGAGRALGKSLVRRDDHEGRPSGRCGAQPRVVPPRRVRHAHEKLRHLMPVGRARRVVL